MGLVVVAAGASESCSSASPATEPGLPAGAVPYPAGFTSLPATCTNNRFYALAAYGDLCSDAGGDVYALCVDGTYSAYSCLYPGTGWLEQGTNNPPAGDAGLTEPDSAQEASTAPDGAIVDGGVFVESGCSEGGGCP
jgi:hypothetical protein